MGLIKSRSSPGVKQVCMEEESVARLHLDMEVLAPKLLGHLHLVRVGARLVAHQEVVNSAQLVASCQHLTI